MLEKQLAYIRSKTDFIPEIGIVLGSGLSSLADKAEAVCTVDFAEIEGMPVSTAPSHKGRFILGTMCGKKVIIMDGRVHIYEGYTPKEVTIPLRLMRLLGADKLILTNAAGGINKNLNVGDFMLINDHISTFVTSPLIGKNDDNTGVRFPDMSCVYDKEMRNVLMSSAKENGIDIKSGIYVQLTGPQFETPAEIKMLSALGADAVGMSTVTEAIAAKHCGFRIAGISLITNLACGVLDKPLTSDEITETADKKIADFEKLICTAIRKM